MLLFFQNFRNNSPIIPKTTPIFLILFCLVLMYSLMLQKCFGTEGEGKLNQPEAIAFDSDGKNLCN